MADKLIKTGRIGAPFAVHGWLHVKSFTHPAENLVGYRPWLLGRDGDWQERNPAEVQVRGGNIIARFEGIDSREAARSLVNLWIACPLVNLPPLDEDEVYWHQLTGLLVENLEGQVLGRVRQMLDTGAQPVLVVGPEPGADGEPSRAADILLPWVPAKYVLDVDLEQGRIQVDWQADW